MVPRERDLERESLNSEEERDRLREADLPWERRGIFLMAVGQGKKEMSAKYQCRKKSKKIFAKKNILRATTETTRSREEKVKTSGVTAEGHHV